MLDGSAALAWCFRDERTPLLMALLDRVEAEGAAAPALWPLEVTNTLVLAHRRNRVSAAERDAMIGFLRDLPVALDDATAAQAWAARPPCWRSATG